MLQIVVHETDVVFWKHDDSKRIKGNGTFDYSAVFHSGHFFLILGNTFSVMAALVI